MLTKDVFEKLLSEQKKQKLSGKGGFDSGLIGLGVARPVETNKKKEQR